MGSLSINYSGEFQRRARADGLSLYRRNIRKYFGGNDSDCTGKYVGRLGYSRHGALVL